MPESVSTLDDDVCRSFTSDDESSILENGYSRFTDRILSLEEKGVAMEDKASANQVDISLLKSALADVLNRLLSVEAELKKKQVKAEPSNAKPPSAATNARRARPKSMVDMSENVFDTAQEEKSPTKTNIPVKKTPVTKVRKVSRVEKTYEDVKEQIRRTRRKSKENRKKSRAEEKSENESDSVSENSRKLSSKMRKKNSRVEKCEAETEEDAFEEETSPTLYDSEPVVGKRKVTPTSSGKKITRSLSAEDRPSPLGKIRKLSFGKKASSRKVSVNNDGKPKLILGDAPKEEGKPKIIVAKKSRSDRRKISEERKISTMRKQKMSVSSMENEPQKLKDDSVKFNTRGRSLTLYPPLGYQEDIYGAGNAPDQKLKLKWVYGYRGKDCRDNLYNLPSGELLYNMAGVIVMYDTEKDIQRHFTQHTSDIRCVAIHPNNKVIASGQVAGHGEDKKPQVLVWDWITSETITSIGQGVLERGVCAVEFSTYENGKYLGVFDESNDHVVYIYEWEKGVKITETKVSKEVIFGAIWNPMIDLSFVTYGKNHLMFWTMGMDRPAMYLTKKAAIYEKFTKPKYVRTVIYTNEGDLVSGDSSGNIFLFKDENNTRLRIAESALSAHKGGVYCLCFLKEKEIILSSGKDGQISTWSMTLEKLNDFAKISEQYGPARCMLYHKTNDAYIIATAKNCILQFDSELTTEHVLVQGHFDELWGLASHPTDPVFASCAYEQLVNVWNSETKKNLWSYYIEEKAECAEFHPRKDYLLIGTQSGTIYFLNYDTKEEEISLPIASDCINDIKVSPDGRAFAAGCRDTNIYLYTWPEELSAIKRPKTLQAHSSRVLHIDWSVDSEYIQSNSLDYELLFWQAGSGLQVLSAAALRDVIWSTWTCPFGFPVMGIWPEGADGTDINACGRSHDRKLIATGDDFGEVKLYRFPSVKLKSDHNIGNGHSSHVTCVRFLANDYGLVSVGGKDSSVMQWDLVFNTVVQSR